jgi:hypothetical protein
MKNSFPFFLLLITVSVVSCRFDSHLRNNTNFVTNQDSIIKIEVQESGTKYNITDSAAIALIQQVPEISQIIGYKYEDPTIFNQVHIENVPTQSDKNWHIQIVQFYPKSEHVVSLLRLLVDANTGKISVFDIPNDTIIPLGTWIEQRTKKQLK